MPKIKLSLSALFGTMFFVMVTTAQAQDIYVPDVAGAEGVTITVPVKINNAPNLIQAFSFKVSFDNARLAYQTSSDTGTLVENFMVTEANEATAGVINVGGFDAIIGIPAGTSGILLYLKFEVLQGACDIQGDSFFTLQNLYDDFLDWTSADGSFLCVTTCTDADIDGYYVEDGCGTELDCDDSIASINPGATDVCDGVDNDCNPATEDGVDEAWLGTACDGTDIDLCEEGAHECLAGFQSCSDISGDDPEECDGVDNNCDGQVDEGCIESGDVNGNGSITPEDALLAFQYYLGITELDTSQQERANVNNDGSITPADALCIFRKYLSMPSCLN